MGAVVSCCFMLFHVVSCCFMLFHVVSCCGQDAVFTPRTEHKFEHMKECTIRGQFVMNSACRGHDSTEILEVMKVKSRT